MAIAYIGIGSNLGDPRGQVEQALQELDSISNSHCVRHSSLYQSEPLTSDASPKDQPDYINAVAELDTTLEPQALLAELHGIEARHGRVREEHWGPRTLDLDILLYDDRIINSPELTVPHPGLYDRNFVLYPLVEIAPDLVIPGAGDIGGLVARCERGSLKKIN